MWSYVCYLLLLMPLLGLCYNNTKADEELLRQNLISLIKGTLKFEDNSTRPYDQDLADTTPQNHSEYDFIVVGAGSAGSVVASRLSEIQNVTVLLIEAGSKEYPIMDIPGVARFLWNNDQTSWRYQTESSNSSCLGSSNSKCNLPSGKAMGGSSVVNAMVATRGNRLDYDDWANMTGDSSWSYDNMLKYLRKLENFHVKRAEVDRNYHNYDGPVHISDVSYRTELGDAYLEAGQELGYSVLDYNGEKQTGFSRTHSTLKEGQRWSTNRAYLQPVSARKNLALTRNSHVSRVLIDKVSETANGVEFLKFGKYYQVRARKEVILSAGALNSPQILMLSGVGPTSHLQEMNIEVIKDAPVGENLMDHFGFTQLAFETNLTKLDGSSNNSSRFDLAIRNYLSNGTGELSSTGLQALSFVNVDDLNPQSSDPNIELIFVSNVGLFDPSFTRDVEELQDGTNTMHANYSDYWTWEVLLMTLVPKSRGRLLLRSKNPQDKPMIYPNYMSESDDTRAFIRGIRMALKLSQTKAFQRYNSTLKMQTLSSCQHLQQDSDQYWECAVRYGIMSFSHYAGTCKMGKVNDSTSVVNAKAQVIGIDKLRVIDASVIPKLGRYHTNIPVIAMAEKLSDVIKEDWDLV